MTRNRLASHVSSADSAPYSMLNSTTDSMEEGIQVVNEVDGNNATTVNIIRLNRSNFRNVDSSSSDSDEQC